jgi:hypothetical protein
MDEPVGVGCAWSGLVFFGVGIDGILMEEMASEAEGPVSSILVPIWPDVSGGGSEEP